MLLHGVVVDCVAEIVSFESSSNGQKNIDYFLLELLVRRLLANVGETLEEGGLIE